MHRTIEKFLEKSFAQGRKELSGYGPLKTRVKVVDDCIYVKFKVDFSGMEKRTFEFIKLQNQDINFYDSVRKESTDYAQNIIDEICNLKIKDADFRIDIDNGYSFALLILDGDLENLIRLGSVTMPTQS